MIFKVARRLVARMDYFGDPPLHFREHNRSLPEDFAASGSSQDLCFAAQQIGQQYQARGRARVRVTNVNLGYDKYI